jgi:hypothetical protein
MVRSNELGCRNGWNADLWVPAATDDGVDQRSQPLNPIGGRAKSEIESAQQNDLITSIVAAKTDNLSLPPDHPRKPDPVPVAPIAVEEDIFVRQTPSLSWSTGPISSQPASELVQNPKAAILRARDQFRERRRTEGRLADREIAPNPAPLLASSREAQIVDEFDLTEPEPAPESLDPRYENRPLLRPAPSNITDSRRPIAPVELREIDRPFPSMTEFPEDRVRFESVPPVGVASADANLSDDEIDDTWIETRQIDTVPPEPYEVDEYFEEDEILATSNTERYEEEELSVRHRESALNRYFRQRRERRERAPQASTPVYEQPTAEIVAAPRETREVPPQESLREARRRAAPQAVSVERSIPAAYQDEARADVRASAWERGESYSQPVSSSKRTSPPRPAQAIVDPDQEFVLPPPLPELQPALVAEQRTAPRSRTRIEQTAPIRRPEPQREHVANPVVDEFGDQPLFASNPTPAEDYEIDTPNAMQPVQATPNFRLERICQTCRDFRPADNGERGWCNNKWAFNHRRMVDADDLACRNSLGSWWTPKDDVWRRDGDISRHAQQTPRVDQWLFGTRSEDEERHRSGS